mgnify:CR=1 FL=1
MAITTRTGNPAIHSRYMIEFSSSDFSPLAEFPLLWRWTQATHHLLTSAIMSTLAPLASTAAVRVAREASRKCTARGITERELSFRAEAAIATAVGSRLDALAIPRDERIVLSWNSDVALVTRWDTFVDHWDAFCYPSSDDVTVMPLRGGWALCYYHDELMEFSRT